MDDREPAPGAPAEVLTAIERKQHRRLLLVLLLIGSFFVVELVGARLARSDVLEADAFHLLMDVFAIGISLLAMRLASRRPSERFTFGLRRAEPIAALTNGVLVFGVAIELVRDAIEHVGSPSMPRAGLMLTIATAALVVNGLNAWLLHGAMGHHGHGHGHGHDDHGHAQHAHAHDDHGHEHRDDHGHDHHGHAQHAHGGHGHGHQLNMRGAWLHLLGDALGSFAAFAAGLAIRFGAPPVVDPLASFVVVAILVVGAVRLVRDAGVVLLESAPAHLPIAKVRKELLRVDGVSRIMNVHVWSLGTGHDAIMARVASSSQDVGLGPRASEHLRKELGVEYVTVEVHPD